MTQLEFQSELEKRNIRYVNKLTKWESSYWTIDGLHYRISDHRKPINYLDTYVLGKNDFSDYSEMLNVVIKNVKENDEFRKLTYEQKEVLIYGRDLLKNDIECFNNWINYHPEFNKLNK